MMEDETILNSHLEKIKTYMLGICTQFEISLRFIDIYIITHF